MRSRSASRLALAHECVYPWSPEAQWVTGSRPEARLGNAFHDHVERFSRGPIGADIRELISRWELDDEQASELRDMIAVFHQAAQPRTDWMPEIAFAYDPATDTARILGHSIGRDYSGHGARPDELVGSADIAWNDSGVAVIKDWKTGRQENLEPASEHIQGKFLALCAARAWGLSRARVDIVHVTGEDITVDSCDLDAFDLDLFSEELRGLSARIDAGGPPNPGAWCTALWCPCVATCPATVQAAADMVPVPESKRHLPMVASADAIQSREHAGSIWVRLKAIEEMAEQVRAAVKAYVDDAGPVPLGDGTELRCRSETHESVEVDAATMAVLARRLGDETESVVKRSITKAAIERAARKVAGPGKPGNALNEALLGDLREAGLVRSAKVIKHVVAKIQKGKVA